MVRAQFAITAHDVEVHESEEITTSLYIFRVVRERLVEQCNILFETCRAERLR